MIIDEYQVSIVLQFFYEQRLTTVHGLFVYFLVVQLYERAAKSAGATDAQKLNCACTECISFVVLPLGTTALGQQ